MRKFTISSETRALAEIIFHGDSVDAAGEAHIVQGTEATIEAILDIMGHALMRSKTMTHEANRREAAPPPTPVTSETAQAAAPANEVVSDLSAFRAKKGARRQLQ